MRVFKEHIVYEGTDSHIFRDDRIFSDCVIYQLDQVRNKAQELILAAAPEYKQRNAALGLLTEQETQQIKDSIQAIRTISNQKEAEINAITWDGQESTRAAACDAVQNIIW